MYCGEILFYDIFDIKLSTLRDLGLPRRKNFVVFGQKTFLKI